MLTFIFPDKQNDGISTRKKDERCFQTLQDLTGRSQMEGWCCFVFWRGNLRATLAGKPPLLGAGWVIYDRLTVSGSFSNTSLASSLEHLSSTHSLSKCPCFVSSKTWFALLCLLRNWFASWGDNETTKETHPPPRMF